MIDAAGRARALPMRDAGFGEYVLGPIFAEFALRLWVLSLNLPRRASTRILFCARGGLRMRLLYQTFLAAIGERPPAPFDDLMVSRLIAARAALLTRAPQALEEIGREFDAAAMRDVAAALTQEPLSLGEEWDAPFEKAAFESLLWDGRTAGETVRAAIAEQNRRFRAHFDAQAAGAGHIVLCDSGLYGSTIRLLSLGMPDVSLSCALFARANYKGFATEHFSRTVGLSIEADAYSIVDLRTSVFRFWQLIEHVLEPDLESVRRFEESADGRPSRSNLERRDWRAAVAPAPSDLFAGVLAYVRLLDADSFGRRIYEDSAVAWPELKRIITRPRLSDVASVAIANRSRDFGRTDKIAAVADLDRAGFDVRRLRSSLWREGTIARSWPAFSRLALAGLEGAHLLRTMNKAVRGLVARISAKTPSSARLQ